MDINLIKSKIDEYMSYDPIENSSYDLIEMFNAGKYDDINKLLSNRLIFGTAGLRGPMGSGYNKMNGLTVLQTTQGLVAYLIDKYPDIKQQKVLIGYDHRSYKGISSEVLALIAASVFRYKNIPVILYNKVVCTPLVPFGICNQKCICGIMVTASHNPKQDNGYKLYWSNGVQIISPIDEDITKYIDKNLVPWTKYDYIKTRSDCIDLTQAIIDEYIKTATNQLCTNKQMNLKNPAKIIYTAMHGVGYPFVKELFSCFGHTINGVVECQCNPDPEFPTVRFPNPEEGMVPLALAIKQAQETNSNIVIATDPDADRLALVELDGDGHPYIFHGDEIGILIADWQYRQWIEKNKDCVEEITVDESGDLFFKSPNTILPPKIKRNKKTMESPCMITTAVSSNLLEKYCDVEGIAYSNVLTGFKWLGNESDILSQHGYNVLLTYEEAIGYCVGSVVKDKDGVVASAVICELIRHLYLEKETVLGRLNCLYNKYGYYRSHNSYVISNDQTKTLSLFDNIRNNGRYMFRFGNNIINRIRDLTVPFDSGKSEFVPTLPIVPSVQMITFWINSNCRITIRTSGTEPKIKYYIEGNSDNKADAQMIANNAAHDIIQYIIQPDKFGFETKH